MFTHYFRVGLIAVLVLAIGVAWTVRQSRDQFNEKEWLRFEVLFDDARGLTPGTEVLKAGVSIGRVHDITLHPSGRALVSVEVLRSAQVREDAEFLLKEEIIGDTKMLIDDKSSTGPYITNDTPTLDRGRLPLPIDDVMASASESIRKINELLDNVNKIAGNKDMEEDVLAAVSNIADMTAEALEVTRGVRAITDDNRKNIDRLMAGLAKSAENTSVATENAIRVTESLDEAIRAANALVSNLNDVAGDEQVKEDVKDSIAELHEFLENVVGDETTQQELRDSVNALKESVRSVQEILEAWKATLTDPGLISDAKDSVTKAHEMIEAGSETLTRIKGVVTAMSETEVHPTFLFRYETRNDKYRADMDLRFVPPSQKVYYVLGLDDVGEESGTNLQLGVFTPYDSNFRFGLKRGKLGVGFEQKFGDYIYQADLLDPNDLQFNFRVGKQIGENLHALVGIEDLLEKNSVSLGLYQRY